MTANGLPDPNRYLSQYQYEMEKQAIEQAKDFLRRYGILPPEGTPIAPAAATQAQGNSGDLVTIPVTNKEHAENAPVDAFRTFMYPNFAAGEIYVKKLGEDGKAVVDTYLPRGAELTKTFEEMMKKIMGTMAYIDERMKSIENKLGVIPKENNNTVEEQNHE